MQTECNETSADRLAGESPRSLERSAPGGRLGERESLRSLWRLVIFFCLGAISASVLDRAITLGLRRIKTSEFGISNRVMSGQVNAQVIISGSSRALVHYDPRVIESITGETVFNLGRNAAQTDMQWAFLKAYLKHNAKPRVVVHNLDAFCFSLSREVYDPGQYLPYLSEREIYEPLRKIDPDVWKWRYIPLYGYAVEDMNFTWMKGLMGLVGWNPHEDHFLGFNPRQLKWTGDFERFRAQHPGGTKLEIDERAVALLSELIETCQAMGIQVVLVFSPEYRDMQSLAINRAEVFSRFQRLADRYQIPFWDYSQAQMCGRRELFYNSQHMNSEGAAIFSRAVAERLATLAFPDHRAKTASTQAAPH